MRQSRLLSPEKIARVGSDAPSPASSLAGAPLSTVPGYECVIRDAHQSLAPSDSVEHDSNVVHVTDDWPSIVPISSDEVDVIEAFLRREIDTLLR